MTRTRADRCPGVLRPWPADDGPLVRIRIPGGRLGADRLSALADLTAEFGDGFLRLTSRANIQVRSVDPDRAAGFVAGVRRAGLLPSTAHDLVRNIVCSPLTGKVGGRADLVPVLEALDRAICADEALAALPGKFLFALDDGRGDVCGLAADVLAYAVAPDRARVLVGGRLAEDEVPVEHVPAHLTGWARRFLGVRRPGAEGEWHVAELADPAAALDLGAQVAPPAPVEPPWDGPILRQADGRWIHRLSPPGGVLTADRARDIAAAGTSVVITPGRELLHLDLTERPKESR